MDGRSHPPPPPPTGALKIQRMGGSPPLIKISPRWAPASLSSAIRSFPTRVPRGGPTRGSWISDRPELNLMIPRNFLFPEKKKKKKERWVGGGGKWGKRKRFRSGRSHYGKVAKNRVPRALLVFLTSSHVLRRGLFHPFALSMVLGKVKWGAEGDGTGSPKTRLLDQREVSERRSGSRFRSCTRELGIGFKLRIARSVE